MTPGPDGLLPAIRLVQIRREGSPGESGLELPPVAQQALADTAALYGRVGFQPPWVGYLTVSGGRCVGTCALAAPPRGGRVEIAYDTFPGNEGQGFATATARGLVDLARATAPDVVVTAQTLPEENASTRVLAGLGFRLVGTVPHPEEGPVWEWQLPPVRGRA